MADVQDGAVFVHQAPEGHEDQMMHPGKKAHCLLDLIEL